MRLSVQNLRNFPVSCFVNGAKQQGVIEADTIQGWCRKVKRGISGELLLSPDREDVQTETVHGDVSIRWDRIAPNWTPEART